MENRRIAGDLAAVTVPLFQRVPLYGPWSCDCCLVDRGRNWSGSSVKPCARATGALVGVGRIRVPAVMIR